MKIQYLFSLCIVVSCAYAAYPTIDIDAQIEKIRHASPTQRVSLMNALKIQLSQMNEEDRLRSLNAIRNKMQSETNQNVDEHSQTLQTQESLYIQQHQNANHTQALDQVIHKQEDDLHLPSIQKELISK